MPKIETSHLITLSEFVEQIKRETSNFTAKDAIDIIAYNDFLNKEASLKEVEEIFKNDSRFFSDFWGRMYFENKYFKSYFELAELTKENPLRFKEAPYYETIH